MADRTYSLSGDFPGGKINARKMEDEIRAAGSGVTTMLNSIGVSGDTVTMRFAAALSAGEATALDADTTGPAGGLIAAHDNTASAPTSIVQIDQTVEQRVYPSPRPATHKTYFSSAGDVTGPGDGPLLLFNMGAGDAEKSVTIEYDEDVLIKDGYITCAGAPLGSWVSAEMYAPDGTTKVGAFVVRALMLGDARMPFDTEDYGSLPATYKLRLTVHNSDGTGDEDPAAAFKVVARVEMYRVNTI